MAELGADVALVDIRLEKTQENADAIAKRFGVKAIAVECDVTDPEQVKKMVETVVDEFGRIDCVHSNAGIVANDDTVDISYESWQKMVAVNFTGMFLVDQACAVWMRENGVKGAIVNTASMSAHIINRCHFGDPHMICYNATKGGVMNLTKGMAMGFVESGIRFNSISPGYMWSGIHDNMDEGRLKAWADDVPMGRFGTMNEIGGLVAFLVSDLAEYMTGADVLIDGGYCVW